MWPIATGEPFAFSALWRTRRGCQISVMIDRRHGYIQDSQDRSDDSAWSIILPPQPSSHGFALLPSIVPSLRRTRPLRYNSREETFSPRGDEEERLMTLAMAPSSNIIIAPDAGMPFLFQSPSKPLPRPYFSSLS